MRRALLIAALLVTLRCASPAPAPAPVAVPEAQPPAAAAPATETAIGTVVVDASALNVRSAPSADGEIVRQVKRGTPLAVLERGDAWVKVRLEDGKSGWVSARYVAEPGAARRPAQASRRGGCPPDSDFAFITTPTPSFSENNTAHGMVIVEANVNTKGVVTSTQIVGNTTGDAALAKMAEREIRAAKFSPPIRNCVPRAFIYTYTRTF